MTFKNFVTFNFPNNSEEDSQKLIHLLLNEGFLIESFHPDYIKLVKEDAFIAFKKNKPVTISWYLTILEDSLLYTPYVFCHYLSKKDLNPSKLGANLLGYEEKLVKFPEKVVTLPIPSWANYPDNTHDTMFWESDAKEVVASFISSLSKFLEK